jgi:hypothetical protein
VFVSTNAVRFGAGSGEPDYAQADSDAVPRNILTGTPLFWRVIYSGDSQNQPSASACDSVNLADALLPVTISAAQQWGQTRLPSLTVPWWATGVIDQAAVTRASAISDVDPPGGRVIFYLFSGQCFSGAPVLQVAENLTTTSLEASVATSAPVGQLAPGTYYWYVRYFGDISYRATNLLPCGSQRFTVTSPISGPAVSTATAVTLPLTCPVAVCRLRITMTVRAPALAIDARKTGKRKPPVITLAGGTVTIRKRAKQQVTLRLTSAGRKFVASHHGRVTVTAKIATTINGHTRTLTRRLTLKIAMPSPARRSSRGVPK